MTKPFNIHDWQAKQKKQRLTEKFDPSVPNSQDLTLAPEIKKYIGQTFASWMSPSNPPFAQEYAQPQYIDKLVGGIMDIIEIRMMGSVNEKEGVPHYTKDGKEWTGATHKMPNGKLMTQNPHNGDSEELFHKEDLDEHHDDEDFPGKDLSAWDLLDKIKSSNEDLYNKVEDFMKSMKENTTGTGASFSAGSGEGYMTPNAFKKKKK